VFLPVGIVFKGSGFYATDHRSPSGANRPAATTEKDDDSKTEKPADVKKDTKPSGTTIEKAD
jgi:predicted nucleic acid-binding Zn ribbon protein